MTYEINLEIKPEESIYKAGARKSLGEYKPLRIKTNPDRPSLQRTTVLMQPQRMERNPYGLYYINKYGRGTTFATREEALAAAQEMIDEEAEKMLDDIYEEIHCKGNSPEDNKYIQNRIDTLKCFGWIVTIVPHP